MPLAVALLLGALGLSLAYWPGLMTYDSVRQYDQALSGAFDDWHPPVMEWIWRGLIPLQSGPALMLLLQLALYGGGMLAFIGWAARAGRPRLALAMGACALLPIPVALMGEVIKDCLMAGALTAAAGLTLLGLQQDRRAPRIAALALVLFAATLRFNAFLAGVPILLVAAGPVLRVTWTRLALSAALAAVVLLGAMPLANRLVGAKPSDVSLSLVIFDLAGITVRTGEDAFPPMNVADPVNVVRQCYALTEWDSFSWWKDPLCPINFERVRQTLRARHINAYGYWIAAILHHPVAYAEHRLAHWNLNAHFLTPDDYEQPVQRESAPNQWGFQIVGGRLVNAIDAAAHASAATPLGWPCVWMALAAGLLLVAGRLPSALAIRMLAGSALLYGLGYGVFSVASELRYYLWTIVAATLAAAIAIADLRALPGRRRWPSVVVTLGPAGLIALLAVIARI